MSDTPRKTSRVERRHHKVDRLPPHLLDQVRERVQRGESYEAVEAWLDRQGYRVGHSSIHRWHKFIRNTLPLADERARLAEMLVSASAVDPSVVQNAAYQLVMQQTLDLLMAADEGEALDPQDLAKIMSALARFGTGTALAKHLDERRRQQAARADQTLKTLQQNGQLSPEARTTIERIYGLVKPEPEAPAASDEQKNS